MRSRGSPVATSEPDVAVGGVFDQRPNLGTFEALRHFCINLEPDLHPTARKRRELLDDRLDNLMNVPRRPLR